LADGAWLVAVLTASLALERVYSVVLYRYAVDGTVGGGFSETDLRDAFRRR
jgi:hypothetical protein